MKPSALKKVADGFKKQAKLSGVFKSGVVTQLAFRGYPKSSKVRFDCGNSIVQTMWIMGVRERREEARVEGEGEHYRRRVFQCSNVPSLPRTIFKIAPLFLVKTISLHKLLWKNLEH